MAGGNTLSIVLADEIARDEAIDITRVSQFCVDPNASNRRLNRLPDRNAVFCEFVEQPVVLDPRSMKGASRILHQLLGYSSVVNGFDSPWNSASSELRPLAVPATIEY